MKKLAKKTMPAIIWLAALPAELAEKAQKNAENHPLFPMNQVGSIAYAVATSFSWSTTPEGGTFWFNVYRYYWLQTKLICYQEFYCSLH